MPPITHRHWGEFLGHLSSLVPAALSHLFISQATPIASADGTLSGPGEPLRIAVDAELIRTFDQSFYEPAIRAMETTVGARVEVVFVAKPRIASSDEYAPRTPSGSDLHRVVSSAAAASTADDSDSWDGSGGGGSALDRAVPGGPVGNFDRMQERGGALGSGRGSTVGDNGGTLSHPGRRSQDFARKPGSGSPQPAAPSNSMNGRDNNGAAYSARHTNNHGGHSTYAEPSPSVSPSGRFRPSGDGTVATGNLGSGRPTNNYGGRTGTTTGRSQADTDTQEILPSQMPSERRVYTDTHSLPLRAVNTFDSFIVGPSNRIAHAAAAGVTENPGTAYNPLFLHGSVGLGKTHLLQAIAHQLQVNHPGIRLLYISCETFISQYIHALASRELERFQRQFRELDCLIIDDIHFLGGNRVGTQDEFFHTFNTLYGADKQIVISSDSPAGEIPELSERLVSRFKAGLQARIEPPVYETRYSIIQQKAQQLELGLDEEVISFMAEKFEKNVREIEGAVKRLSAVARQLNESMSIRHVKTHLSDLLAERNVKTITRLSGDDILEVVTNYFGVDPNEVKSARRQKHIAEPRQYAMFLMKRHTTKTLTEIGEVFGGRDHSTVIHSVGKIEKALNSDDEVRGLVALLERKLQNL